MQILVLKPNFYTFTIYIKVLGTAGKVDESWIKAGNTMSVRGGKEMWVWLELSVRGSLGIEQLPTTIFFNCMQQEVLWEATNVVSNNLSEELSCSGEGILHCEQQPMSYLIILLIYLDSSWFKNCRITRI